MYSVPVTISWFYFIVENLSYSFSATTLDVTSMIPNTRVVSSYVKSTPVFNSHTFQIEPMNLTPTNSVLKIYYPSNHELSDNCIAVSGQCYVFP